MPANWSLCMPAKCGTWYIHVAVLLSSASLLAAIKQDHGTELLLIGTRMWTSVLKALTQKYYPLKGAAHKGVLSCPLFTSTAVVSRLLTLFPV